MRCNIPGPLEAFETWLLRRVAQAEEAGDVPASLLAELRANFEAVRTTAQEERHAAAIQHLTEIAEIPSEQEAGALESIEAQPSVMLVARIRET